jgi:hypothetical protein
LAVFQDFSKKCSNSRTDSKFQDIPGQIFFSRISRTGGRPAFGCPAVFSNDNWNNS